MEEISNIAIVKKIGSDLPIHVDVSRIVAITDVTKGEEPSYYIYFDFAVWSVQAESHDEVYTKWVNFFKNF